LLYITMHAPIDYITTNIDFYAGESLYSTAIER